MNPTLQALMDGAKLTAEETQQLLERYPYFAYPAIRLATDTPETDPALLASLRRRVAVNIGDTDALLRLFGPDPEAADAEFYPDQTTPAPDTTSTIDAFLSRFGASTVPAPEAVAQIPEDVPAEIPVEAPAIDYAAIMAADSTEATPPVVSATPAPAPAPSQTPALSESLARIMIKNGNYAKALEIITGLRAKNPQKSIYFADQIRFLRKLIINDNYLQH